MVAHRAGERAAVREAAELIAFYDAMAAAQRNVSLRLAWLTHQFIIRLTKAQGHTERYEWIPPTDALGRGLTLFVRSRAGHVQAYLAINAMSRETAEARLEEGDAGFFHRPEDWLDPRYYGALHDNICTPSRWRRVPDAENGFPALLAYAAKRHADLDAETLQETMDRKGGPSGYRWRPEVVAQVVERAQAVVVPDREPAMIPVRVLRQARLKGVGYGETLAFWLYRDAWGPGLPAREVAFLLNVKTDDQAKKMARDAHGKLGGLDTLMRLVPPWPKESLSNSRRAPAAAAPAPRTKLARRGGERYGKRKRPR